tara:strand:+ start:19 stop:876 length:858 start_codon:yes stop_codon:yes gene_type:complete
MIKLLAYLIQSIFCYFSFLIARIIGLKFSRKIFSGLFLLVGPFFRSKKIIDKNLNIVFPMESDAYKKKISENMWKNYGMTFIEYIFLNKFKRNNSHVEIEGIENLSSLSEGGNPVIFISGHFANFELMSMEITKRKIKLATIYRPLNNFFLNPFMEYLRKKYICENQIKKGINGVKETIKFIEKNHSIALMIDQRVSEGDKINFFNNPALTTTLPAQLSIRFNLDIVPVFIKRKKNNIFKIDFQKRLKPKEFENKETLTKELNKILEKMIMHNPDQWIWTHNRWK